jgi:hypothetical protein
MNKLENSLTHSIYDSQDRAADQSTGESKDPKYNSSLGEVGFKQILGNKHGKVSKMASKSTTSPDKSEQTFKKPLYKREDSFDLESDLNSPLSPSRPSHAAIAMKAAIAGVNEVKSKAHSHQPKANHHESSHVPNLLSPHLKPINDTAMNENEKYFGMNARVDFFERYHWLSHQQSITNSSTEKKIDELLFDNEVYEVQQQQQPFQSPHRGHQQEKRSPSKSPTKHGLLSSTHKSMGSPVKKSHTGPNNATLQKTNSIILPTLYGERRRSTDSVVNRTQEDDGSLSPLQDMTKSFPMTPRSRYLAACLSENVNPRASLIIRKELTKEIHLQHQGIGDHMAKLLAESMEGLPYLESINIADNRLTDVGMEPMLNMIALVPNLKELDLSQNIIGPKAAEALSIYLCNPKCPLERLVLQHADVDDGECKKFVDTLAKNRSVVEIDLSSNKIGESQGQRSSHKDGKQGVDAIAEMLASSECRLRSLKLSWNMIRLSGATHLAESLATNQSLHLLDLSYNSLGKEGGLALGNAIQYNHTIQNLYLSNNNIDGEASFTIAAGILENKSLKRVSFDGNPIGELGARALMMIPFLAGSRVKISASKCNIHIKDHHSKFDFSNLACDYNLSMNDPFERAIVIILTYLLALHPTYEFKSFIHDGNNNSGGQQQGNKSRRNSQETNTIKLVQINLPNEESSYDDSQRKAIESLKKLQLASMNSQLMRELFQEVDEDGSGLIDPQELRKLMQLVGVDDIDDKRLADIIDVYDTSGDNQLDMNGFAMLIRGQYAETTARLHELTTRNVIAVANTTERYLIPATGRIRCSVVDSFCVKQNCRTMTACDKNYLFEVTGSAGDDKADMISYGIDTAIKFRLDEGLAIYNGMKMNIESNAKILRRLLPSTTNSVSAMQMIKHITGSNRSEMVRLKHEMGYSLKPIIGAPNGYYSLDMSKEMDRLCLSRLITISTTHADIRQRLHPEYANYPHLGDVSQKGNYSCFRNEFFNGHGVTIDASFATPMPVFGKLEFDFCTADLTTDPSLVVPMSDKKFVKTLVRSYLLPIDEVKAVMKKLSNQKKACNSLMSCTGKVIYRAKKDRAEKIGETLYNFYKELGQRSKILEENASGGSKPGTAATEERERLTTAAAAIADARGMVNNSIIGANNQPAGRMSRASSQQMRREPSVKFPGMSTGADIIRGHNEVDIDDPIEDEEEEIDQETAKNMSIQENDDEDDDNDNLVNQLKSSISSLHPDSSIAEGVEGSTMPFTDSSTIRKPKRGSLIPDDFIDNFREIMDSATVQTNMKSKKYLEVCEEIFGSTWLYCRQLAALLEAFHDLGIHKRSKYFGTFRVDLVVTLFDRLVDLHNFELILRVLSPFEIGCCYARIGWLNLFNPMKPDGAHQLDLSRYEERVIVKILSGLMVTEPGENWIDKGFRWQRDTDPVPGWEMVTTWMTDEGLPKRGIMDVTYYSGEGLKKAHCNPQVDFRKSLLALVRIDEKDIIEEGKDKDSAAKDPLPGELHRRNYSSKFAQIA